MNDLTSCERDVAIYIFNEMSIGMCRALTATIEKIEKRRENSS